MDTATALEAIDNLPPGLGVDGAEAAAAAAAAAGESEIAGLTVEEAVAKVHLAQEEQEQLIQSMQSRIAGLEAEVEALKSGQQWVVKASPTPTNARAPTKISGKKAVAATTEALLADGTAGNVAEFATTDDEIDAIMESRRQRKAWPLKRKYVLAFTNEEELHHAHKCVRIPKVDKSEGERYGLGNREGRLICRLCSGKAGNRNTSWMCSTCCVPLCVDLKATGDERTSCLARWHLCRDLVTENAERNHALSEKRASNKRSREGEAGGENMQPVGIETHVAEVPPVLDHDPVVNML
ncbi:hypothetical protein ACHAXT_013229 [Thalassiosira profunda]